MKKKIENILKEKKIKRKEISCRVLDTALL